MQAMSSVHNYNWTSLFVASAFTFILFYDFIRTGDAKRVVFTRKLDSVRYDRVRVKLNDFANVGEDRSTSRDLIVAPRRSQWDQIVSRSRPVLPKAKKSLASTSANAFWSMTMSVVSMCSSLAPSPASLRRRVKGYFSSDIEMLLLRLTEPICAAPAPRDLALLVELIGRLEQTHSALSDRNPYRVVMRKLWHKVTEPSPWTTIRTACAAHYLMRHVDQKDASFIRSTVLQLQTENCDKSGQNYFDRRTAMRALSGRDSDWNILSSPEQRLYRAYVKFVLAFLSSPTLRYESITAAMNAKKDKDTKLLDALGDAIREMGNVSARCRQRESLMGVCCENLLQTACTLLAGSDTSLSEESAPPKLIPVLLRRVQEMRNDVR